MPVPSTTASHNLSAMETLSWKRGSGQATFTAAAIIKASVSCRIAIRMKVGSAKLAVALALVLAPAAMLSAQAQDDAPQPVAITKGPRVESATESTAIIAWSTNVNASTLVRYGADPQKLT